MSNSGRPSSLNRYGLKKNFRMARGELGILKKKHVGVHKDLEEQKTGLHSMQAEQNRLEIVIKGLEKDIAELKREIKGRDEAVLAKERR